ncbi:angiopoietin-1 receptor-like [Gigantopelta aegis]|uniref:angiopoietin-1 receptor-like n=1 Tax=Gigantopelta aegis TaxID=1735272 RepID=UPI001B889F1F|nr:angiopoietin-1 receptor-like [Gigantopelta aegis]
MAQTTYIAWAGILYAICLSVCARPKECLTGHYGVDCEKLCGQGCRAGCNRTTGICAGGCNWGWRGAHCDQGCQPFHYGANCIRSCGHCRDDRLCDPYTGLCTHGCVPGWQGTRCDQVCEPYTYGVGCYKKCGQCRLKQACNMVTGVCSSGCESGWQGKQCSEKCPYGQYGVDCVQSCGYCRGNTTCDHVTGHCLQGCQPGWTGSRCRERCHSGRFGSSCRGTCGRCLKGTCDHVTGTCFHGCARGWNGVQCINECDPGFHGANCSVACGHCKNSTVCDFVNGICSKGCAPGWRGVFCKEECGVGFYGHDCKFRCGKCKTGPDCDKASGVCKDGCEDKWTGSHCSQVVLAQESADSSLKPIMPVLIVSLLLVALVLVSTVLYFIFIRPRKLGMASRLYRLTHQPAVNETNNTYEEIQGSPYEIARHNLILTEEQLGNGQFGLVKKGFIKMHRGVKVPVAIKSLKDNASEKDKRDFLNELTILRKVGKHANVVCLVGACHIRGVMYVAMEYAKHGDMRTFLRRSRKMKNHTYSNSNPGTTLRQTTLLKFALDTASGLAHLADHQIIHRDVAARNVLLADHLVAKIADFGLSKNEDTYVKTSSTRVPIRWMAVESLFTNVYTTQSDVWSFGITLWEIFSLGATPYSSLETQQLFNLLKEGYRLKMPTLCDQNLYAMMLQCWNENPERRPTFAELAGRLQRMLEDSQVYMNISMDDDSHYAEIDHGN